MSSVFLPLLLKMLKCSSDKEWYPDQDMVKQAATMLFSEAGLTLPEDSDQVMGAHGYETVQVQTAEEWETVVRALSSNNQLQHPISLRMDTRLEKGWVLREMMDPATGGMLPVQTPEHLPVNLCFEADDEAERELQAEVEAERGNGPSDGGEGLSKDEWRAMVSRQPSFQQWQRNIRMEHLPKEGAAQTGTNSRDHAIWDAPNLFQLSKLNRARLVAQHIAQQAASRRQDLEVALTTLTQACEEEESTDVAMSESLTCADGSTGYRL